MFRQVLTESPSVDEVTKAIDGKYRVIINYHSKGEDEATGPRMIEVYAYGLTKAGNPVIRAFQPYGDTTSRVPSWKFFRLDRISEWQPTKQRFSRPASEIYHGLGDFNPNGDETMSVVYKIAKFGNERPSDVYISKPNAQPRLKTPTTTKAMQQQLKKQQQQQQQPEPQEPQEPEVYKTDAEKNMERLRQQLNNPVYLDQFKNVGRQKEKSPEEKMAIIRQQLNDPEKMNQLKMKNSFQDVDQKLAANPQSQGPKMKPQDNVYKTDAERNMEKLRQQLNNPQYIDPKLLQQ